MSKRALQIIRENIKKHYWGEDANVLDLGNCNLEEIPSEALECVWIKELILSSRWSEYDFQKKNWDEKKSQNKGRANQIAALPSSFSALSKLEKIVISGTMEKEWALADLSPLADLANLQLLSCDRTQVSNLSPVSRLRNLQQFYCESTQVSDLSPLAGLENLQQFYCESTQVSDLSPLAGLENLQHLSCHSTHIANLSPLAGLTNLQLLNCSSTPVSDLSPLTGLNNLQQLHCSSTQVSDLSPLAGLENLQKLDCESTLVSNLSPILFLIEKGIPVKWVRDLYGGEFYQSKTVSSY